MDYDIKYGYRPEVLHSPLHFLHKNTRRSLSSKLDSKKIILTTTKFHRDWRGLAEIADLELSTIRSSKISFTEHCLYLWGQNGGLIGDLIKALEAIDRYDVIDDHISSIYEDYDKAINREALKIGPVPASFEDDGENSLTDFDSNVITTDDQKNLREGGTLQYYDALVLFADEDLDFVTQMVEKLEGEFNLKLCLKDRDLIGGLSFEFSAVIRLIEERCARVIVVLSPAFFDSPANQFFTRFAHALSIDKQRRIVIPCMYKPCVKPPEILFCHSLDYYRTKGYWDYWKKLADSITSQRNSLRWTNDSGYTSSVSSPAVEQMSIETVSFSTLSVDEGKEPVGSSGKEPEASSGKVAFTPEENIQKKETSSTRSKKCFFSQCNATKNNLVDGKVRDSSTFASPVISPTLDSSTTQEDTSQTRSSQDNGIRSILKNVVKYRKRKKSKVLA